MSLQGSFSTTLLRREAPHQETRFADTCLYRCEVKLLCVRQNNVLTSLDFGALLSTGHAYSVVLPFISEPKVRILCEEIYVPFIPTWFGIPCKVVKVGLGLAVLEDPRPRP